MEEKSKSIDYLAIIKKAFTLTWSRRNLWWFGFLASLSGSSLYFNFPLNGSDDDAQQSMDSIVNFAVNHKWLILTAASLFILLFIVIIIFSTLGRGALIKTADDALRGQATAKFKSELKNSGQYFWRLLAISFTLGFFLFLVTLVLAIPIVFLFINNIIITGIFLLILAFLILVPLSLLAVFLRNYGYLYAILGYLKFWDALENAYLLLRKNILSSLILIILFIPINITFFVIAAMIMLPVVVIFFVVGLVAYAIAKNIGVIIIVSLGLIILIPLILLLKSIFETFSQLVWIIFFHEIAKPKIKEKIREKVIEPKISVEPDVASGI